MFEQGQIDKITYLFTRVSRLFPLNKKQMTDDEGPLWPMKYPTNGRYSWKSMTKEEVISVTVWPHHWR